MKTLTRTLLTLPLLAVTTLLSAQTIHIVGSTTAISADTMRSPLAQVGGTFFYPYTGISVASGTADMIDGFTSLVGINASDLSYAYNNLVLSNYVSASPGPGTSVETYTPGGGSSFTFSVLGQTIATGDVVSFIVSTGYNTGLATAVGTVHLTTPGMDPAFFNEINAITGGTNIVDFVAPNLFADLGANLASATFHSDGTLSVTPVPEPSTFALGAGLLALSAVGLRRRSVRKS